MNWVTVLNGKQALVNTIFNIQILHTLGNFLIKQQHLASSLSDQWHSLAPGRRHDAVGPRGEADPQRYRITKFVVGYFELVSVLLTEGSILDHCYKIEELLRQQFQEVLPFIESNGPLDVLSSPLLKVQMFSSSPFSQLPSVYGFDSRSTERLSYTRHSNSPVQILSFSLRDHYCFQHNRSIPACCCVVGTVHMFRRIPCSASLTDLALVSRQRVAGSQGLNQVDQAAGWMAQYFQIIRVRWVERTEW